MLYKLFYTHNRSKHIGHFFKQNLFKDVHAVREEEATWGGRLPCAFLQSLTSGIPLPQPIIMVPYAIHQSSPSVVPSAPKCQSKKKVPLYYRILIQEYKTHPLIFIVGTSIFLEYLQRYQILRFIYYKFYDIIFIIIQYTVYL